MHFIHIQWEDPFSLYDLPSLMDGAMDYGIYQIYGNLEFTVVEFYCI